TCSCAIDTDLFVTRSDTSTLSGENHNCPGACCADLTCTEVNSKCDCEGIFFEGEGCDPSPCDFTIGACCVDGECFCCFSQEVCEAEPGGVYQGDGSDCTPNPCI